MKLTVENLNAFYGPAHILFDVSFSVGEGEVVALASRLRNPGGRLTSEPEA